MSPEANGGTVNYRFKSGNASVFRHATPVLHVRIGIDPSEAESKDDKFTLSATDGSYEKTLTVKDDRFDGDEFVDLIYEDLKVGRSYTLKVDPGAEGEPYNLFENEPYDDIISYYSVPDPGDEIEDDEEDEEQTGTPEDAPDWDDEGDGGSEHGGDFDPEDDEMERIFEEEEDGPAEEEIDWNAVDLSRPPADWLSADIEDDADDDEQGIVDWIVDSWNED